MPSPFPGMDPYFEAEMGSGDEAEWVARIAGLSLNNIAQIQGGIE